MATTASTISREELPRWARTHLELAAQILTDPGGGLLFATQTMGQVRAALSETGEEEFGPVIALLHRAEDAVIRRMPLEGRRLIAEATSEVRG